jgi:hypothetical protein
MKNSHRQPQRHGSLVLKLGRAILLLLALVFVSFFSSYPSLYLKSVDFVRSKQPVSTRNETRPHEGNVSNATTIVEPLSNSKNKTRSWDNSQAFKAASEQPVPTKNETRRHGNVYQSHANVSNATTSMEPLSFGACCDLEHRITRNLNTLVSAMRTKRHAYVCWKDIQWNVIFNDTAHITEGKE